MKNYENLIPKGWKRLNGTTTQPHGCIWICNGKSLFEKDKNGKRLYKSKVLIANRELFEKTKTSRYTKNFIKHHGKEVFYNP